MLLIYLITIYSLFVFSWEFKKLDVNQEFRARVTSINDWGCKKECLTSKGLQMITLGLSPIYL
jgi:hypothetical protein